MILKIIPISFLSLILSDCNNNTKPKAVNVTEDFKYVPLTALNYKPADISPGTEVEILANFDGPKDNGDTVF
ncbi:MAG: hypothetical protein RIS73_672, partial [Bacteroidota bacterium]